MTSLYVKCNICGAVLDRYSLEDDPRTGDGTFGRGRNEATKYATTKGWRTYGPVGEEINICPLHLMAESKSSP